MRSSGFLTFSAVAVFGLFLAVDGARPQVRRKVGGVAELECTFPPSTPAAVSSGSPHVVEWVRQGLDIPVLIKFGSHTARVHPQYEGRVSLVRITALRLEGLQLDDQGLYECRILLLDQPKDERQNGTWTLLSVTAPPTFTKAPPPSVESWVGARLSLACVANGNPPPTITWLKDGRVIDRMTYQDGVFSVPAASSQAAGRYACHASNSEGNVTVVTEVKVKGPPVIVVPPRNTSLNVSQNALLRCQAEADPPNMTYVWKKGGANVYHVESLKSRVKIMVDGTLLISAVTPEDSGNYTCMPTNGLLTPPTASAQLTVLHPAQALQMPQETYLPTGMDGAVTCPAVAQPPLLRVLWTKDGEPLDLSVYPGWTSTPNGSLLMATVNDDTAGVYTCMPYNSYGSMGPSGPTKVILQDPPSFSVAPEKQYKQDVGRTLSIPCRGNDDSATKVTWTKVDPARRTSYSIEASGSLLLQPVTKDHQGAWECSAANRVASVKVQTQVFVLGTSPHAATSVSVSPGVSQANISWEAGFDGGSAQTFSVWVKEKDRKQDWFSVPVPVLSGSRLQVTGLSPSTLYQFSILSHNKVGTGPFSEIVAVRTLDPPRTSRPAPPHSLSATRSPAGVVLRWTPPDAQHPPITAFVLQSRAAGGEWFGLDDDVSANSSEIVVRGLHKDGVYELRLLSRRGELLSEPSPSVNVSTIGMDIYPSTSRRLENVPEPLLAGVLGGVGFLGLVLVLLLGSACLISQRRERRSRKRQDESPPAIYKCPLSSKTSGTGSTDSMLKKSLLPTTPSSQTDCSSLSSQQQRKQLSSNHLTRTTSSPTSPPIELISRGPDGRFLTPLYGYDTLGRSDRPAGCRRSASLQSEQPDRKQPPFVLSVDLPSSEPPEDETLSHTPAVTQRFPYHECDVCLDCSSLCSNSTSASAPRRDVAATPTFPVLPHIRRSGLSTPAVTGSALVLQMEHERERGNLSRCLKLAQEREELERELQKYSLHRGSRREMSREHPDPQRGGGAVWEYKSSTLPSSQGSSFSSSSVHWDVCSPASVPAGTRFSPCSYRSVSRPSEGAGGSSRPHLAADHQRKHGTAPQRPTVPGHRSLSALSSPRSGDVCVEMSVDEPDSGPETPMLHLRIASHLRHLPRRQSHSQHVRRSLSCYSPASPAGGVGGRGADLWDSKRRSRSLDSRRREGGDFLTPDAWINSLHQGNLSGAAPGQPASGDPQSPATAPRSLPVGGSLSPRRSPQRPSPNPDALYDDSSVLPNAAKWPAADQEAAGDSEAVKESSPSSPSLGNRRAPETDVYEGALECGGSYSSYASSGRGSMEPSNRRVSMCHLSAALSSSPATVEENRGGTKVEPGRRKPSVDENYEWDAADFCSQPGDHHDLLPPLTVQTAAQCFGLPSMHCSSQSRPTCPPGGRPDTVLF